MKHKYSTKRSKSLKRFNFYLSVYNAIKLEGKLPKNKMSKQALNFYVNRLKKEGYIKRIGYGVWETSKSLIQPLGVTTNHYPPYPVFPYTKEHNKEVKSDDVRVHNLVFKLKVDSPLSWEARLEAADKPFSRLDSGVIRVLCAGYKVWLCKGAVVVYVPVGVDYTASKVSRGLLLAVRGFFTWLPGLEAFLGFSLRLGGSYVWSMSRKHLSLVKNALAQDYNKRKEKLRVYDDRGLWLIADDSFSLNELEFVRTSTNQTEAGRVQAWFNDFKANPNLPLPSENYKLILGLTAGLGMAKATLDKVTEILRRLSGGEGGE